MNQTLPAATRPQPLQAGVKLRGADKVARIPVKILPTEEVPRKPDWIRVGIATSSEVARVKALLRKHKLHSVCEEASCPNLGECFSGGTATFMIMGDICTRRCPFCDVGHGRPKPLDADEPKNLAIAIADLRLKYVVITSVDRDDLRDGGAQHFVDCLREIRTLSPGVKLETLVPDYRGRMDVAPGHHRAGAAGRVQPQPGNRAAPVQGGTAGLGLRVVAGPAGEFQTPCAQRTDQIRADAGPG